ncbi:KpsF/GutQ family sugar-phosphate isomerase [uncultured Roseovarius sp.]|uniref:KpsF/GutQ family sugar-phosphate isomerase n=1 Tax=uncultured Roseovarius sp. TaxID=293344 RepID=UPI00260FE2B5|nr:KpsF/GutQ family sugar-phosphate isomerase [uncultured Roseovarius sp.]
MNELTPEPNPIIDAGRRVLEAEAAAITLLAEQLPQDFVDVVRLILAARGRVIVSGIGKSGHIGRKISATLASTGTPSHFVHAAEASHGDLGMISRDDICILISNSGETPELRDIVAHTRRFSIPMVAISSKPDSTLMNAADYTLLLPPAPEACSIGMAPTTSTTLTLALGDALSVALMNQRNFMPEDFRIFHPGGKLGAQMATVAQLMHGGAEIPLVKADTPMPETILEMTSKGFGIAGVTDEAGKLIGVISDGDLRRKMEGLMSHMAGDVASPDPVTISPASFAAQALAILNERKIGALIAVDDEGRPQGVLHIHDCLRAGIA